ncbi:NACHT-domain-containing protein [Lojkania enalia]|uniref:NACHT-domain-containing protein n=1 Tax=Lojkania enalia TaxID=147567 RepID=A0A9P4N1W7_9PLEO|nr:NACHT-domain-containing protein [Didymosphaeria enalia]
MRLLRFTDTGECNLTDNLGDEEAIPPYAILSHTWGADTEEVTFEDLTNGNGKGKPGYQKIRFCGEQAAKDGLEYFWIDTCCIDKKNYAELSQAINSMFYWYRNATRCYVYLADVSSPPVGTNDDPPVDTNDEYNPRLWESDFRKSRWFTRASVEFFSRECKRLGDKSSLKQQIHEITGISESALYGEPLSQFSVYERMSWINLRQTKLEEDKAYSLLGIFGVYIPPRYNEGMTRAFERLQEEINKLEKCVQDLRLTDPRHDKTRIEDTKGGLLEDSYHWIVENSDFQRWCNDQESRLLWIKGDPGKGKTMLLCGIVNELKKLTTKKNILSFFFCQATDSRINSATAVLRGLLYLLVDQQPSLISHIRKKYDYAGKTLFEDTNAWVALSEIFTNILLDPNLNSTYLIVDALDECVTDLPKLLDFIAQNSSVSSRVKWIVSSRNWLSIEEALGAATQKVPLCLELNEKSISAAVGKYIKYKVGQLAQRKMYDNETRNAVQRHLASNADGTFLWVALVCQELADPKVRKWHTRDKLHTFPPGLNSLYARIINQIFSLDDADLCKRVLSLMSVVYRPVTLGELISLVEVPKDFPDDVESLAEIIRLCGSLLTLREGIVYFVHQSAKDFLFEKAFDKVFPSGIAKVNYTIFSKSLQVMSKTLRRDIYSLYALGYPIKQVKQPDPDPLAASRYLCIYWINHLCDWKPHSHASHRADLQDGGVVDNFIRGKYLYWLEALSLCKSMPEGIVLVEKLEALIQGREGACALIELVRDARRFIMSHKSAIQNNPLQAYASALIFSPTRSLIRGLFKSEEPDWITIKPTMQDKWSPCLSTLEGHSGSVNSVAFSPDSARLASGVSTVMYDSIRENDWYWDWTWTGIDM